MAFNIRNFLTENKLTDVSKLLSEAQYGFDLTEISAKDWADALRTVGIKPTAKKTNAGWVWEGSDIVVVTANNPITGEYYNGSREKEKGYASYIGIEGEDDKVNKVAKEIKKKAVYTKGESPGNRDFI